jgi:sugar-specific transcriptional regulator TrmB
MQINEGLNNLGLNNKEARVYTNLLQSGESTAYRIAELTGIKRPTVYVILEELRLKGLVLKIPYVKKQIFSAKSPYELFAESEEKLERARSIMPQLLALTKSESKPKTFLFEGVEGYREAINMGVEEMEDKEILGFYSKTSEATAKVLEAMEENFERRRKLNIKTKGVVPNHESMNGIENRYSNWEIKKIPMEMYSTESAIEMTENYVKIFSKNLNTVVIKDKEISEMFIQIFNIVWANQPALKKL